jgi:acetate kinase
VFTGGIGENSDIVRELVIKDMEFLGIELDADKNRAKKRGEAEDVSMPSSRIKVLVIPTNEELVIARDTRRIAAAD